jgi:nitroreductase
VEFLDVVRTRRSARQFLPRDVPDEVVNELLDAGRLAPTPGNAQGFYFGVVRDPSTKQELAKAAAGQDWVAGAPVVIAHCARLGPDPATLPKDNFSVQVNRLRFGDELIDYLNAYPDRRAMQVHNANGIPTTAGEHVFLAAVNRGLSACWVGHLDTRSASRILRLPDDMVCLFLMPIGYAAGPPGEKPVRSLAECTFHDAWPVSE